MINLQNLLDDVKRYETVRQLRWPNEVHCPHCGAAKLTQQHIPQRVVDFLNLKFSIIQKIIEKMGVEIAFEDEAGIGTSTRPGWKLSAVSTLPRVRVNRRKGGY